MENREKSSNSESRFSLLLSFIRKESLEDVKELLEKWSYLLSLRDKNGRSALHYCTEHSSALCADLILQKMPELLTAQDNDGCTALHLSVISGNQALTRYLISKSDRDYLNCCDNEMHTAIHWATVCGELECLDLLMGSGALPSTADIHGAFPIHYSAQMCSPHSGICIGNDSKIGLSVLNRLLQSPHVDVNCVDNDGRSPLLWAASAGSGDAILALVNAGANVSSQDKDGLTALHCASSRGHVDCVETLITLCNADINQMDANGCSPLFYAVTLGHADCTRQLIQSGADVNLQDFKGRTAAHCGAAKGQLETIKILGQHGANLWLRNIRGDLPLHEAVKSGRRELVKWLLEQIPAAVNATNSFGRSSLHIAAINNNIEMCKILIDVGADVNTVMKLKGHFITPLDAALQKGYRGVAKYLLLHGALPASRISHNSSKSLLHRCLSGHHQIDNIQAYENTSPVDSLDDWKGRTESSESTFLTQNHSNSMDNQRTNLPKLPTLVSHNDHMPETSSSTPSSLLENGNHVRNVREFETQLSERPSNLKQAIITNVYVTNTPVCHSKRVPPLKKVKKRRKSALETQDLKVVKVYTPSLSSSSSQFNGEDNSVKVVLETSHNPDLLNNQSSANNVRTTSVNQYQQLVPDPMPETVAKQSDAYTVSEPDHLVSEVIDTNVQNEMKESGYDINKFSSQENKISSNHTLEINTYQIEDNKSESEKSKHKELDQGLDYQKSNSDLAMINANKSIGESIKDRKEINQIEKSEEINEDLTENIKVVEEESEEVSDRSSKSQRKLENKQEKLSATSERSQKSSKSTISEEKTDKNEDMDNINASKEILRKEFANKADQFMKKVEENIKSDEKRSDVNEDDIVNSNDGAKETDIKASQEISYMTEDKIVAEKLPEENEEIDSHHEIDSETYVKTDFETESEKSTISSFKEINTYVDNSESIKSESKPVGDSLDSHKSPVKSAASNQQKTEESVDKTEESVKNMEISTNEDRSPEKSPNKSLEKSSEKSSGKSSEKSLEKSPGRNSEKSSEKHEIQSNEQDIENKSDIEEINDPKKYKCQQSSGSSKTKEETQQEINEVSEDKIDEKCEKEADQTETTEKTTELDKSNGHEMKNKEVHEFRLEENVSEQVTCNDEQNKNKSKTEDKLNEVEIRAKESESKLAKTKSQTKYTNKRTERVKSEDRVESEKKRDKTIATNGNSETTKKTKLKQVDHKSDKSSDESKKKSKSVSKLNEENNKQQVKHIPPKTTGKAQTRKEPASKQISKVESKKDDSKGLIKQDKVVTLRSKSLLSSSDSTLDKHTDSGAQKYQSNDTTNLSSNQAINTSGIESQNQNAPFFSSEESIFDTSLMLDDFDYQQSLTIQSPIAKKTHSNVQILTPLDHIQQMSESPNEELQVFREYTSISPVSQKLRSESRCSHKLHFKTFPANVGKVEISHIGSRVDSRRDNRYHESKSVSERDVTRHEKEKVRVIKIIRPSSDGYKSIDPSLITQTVEKSLRKYQLERKLFEELHDLKRFQIRSGRSNEILMVKRLVDKFRKQVKAPGMTDFQGPYTYKSYEFYLYDQLRKLSTSNQGKVALLTRSASHENMQLITNSNVSVTCSNPEIMRNIDHETPLNTQQNTDQNQQSDDRPLNDSCSQCLAQSIKKDQQILEDNRKSEQVNEVVEKVDSNEIEKQEKSSQNESGNDREIDLSNLLNETELDYTKFDRIPVDENLSESVRKVQLTASPNISQTDHHIVPDNPQSIKDDQSSLKLSFDCNQNQIDELNCMSTDFQEIDSQRILTIQQTLKTFEDNQITQIENQEEYLIVLQEDCKNFQIESSKEVDEQKFESVSDENEQIKYSQSSNDSIKNSVLEQIEKDLVEEKITESPKSQNPKQKSTKKSYDSQTDQTSEAKSTNGSIKSRKSGVPDKRSIYSGCSSKKSTSLKSNKSNTNHSNISSAYNQKRNINTANKHNEKTTFRKECLKPVKDIEPLERAINRPKFKRTRMTIPPKQEINIPLEMITKRWSDVKEAEMRKLSIMSKYNSNPDVSKHYNFILWYELNKSYRKLHNQFSLIDLNLNQNLNETCLHRTLSDSALNGLNSKITCITTK